MASSAPSNSNTCRVKQVEGVGFSLAGKVSKRERARIECLVEEYIKQNYDVIKSHFAAQGCQGSGSSAVRLCINRTNNRVTVVSVNGNDVNSVPPGESKDSGVSGVSSGVSGSGGGGGVSGVSGGSSVGKCYRRQRKLLLAADSSVEKEKESSITATAIANGNHVCNVRGAAPSISDCDGNVGGTGESIEAAIEYLMARDRKANAEKRPLRSSVPKLQTSGIPVLLGGHNLQSVQTLANSIFPQSKHQQQQQQQMLALHRQRMATQAPKSAEAKRQTATDETTGSVAASLTVGASTSGRIVGEAYDCVARGAAFRRLFPTLCGEFFIFYDHGESHCRSILMAMGFRERSGDDETDQFRTIDQMSISWCNGTISASKRKNGVGFHIVNRLRYRGLITNKCSLVRTMAEFEMNHSRLVPKGLEASSFLPATIHINGARAIDVFHKIRHRGMYLIKPGFSDCGKGIVLYRSDGTLRSLIDTLASRFPNYTQKDLVLQKYIENPLLLGGKKFDLRVFLLVVPNQRKELGVYAFVHPGYVRLACRNYDINSDDLTLHLTNQAIQHKDKTYKTVKEDTVWSPDTLNQYLNKRRVELKVPCADWVKRRLYPRIRSILAHLISIVSSSMCDEPLSFELFGCDFLVDDKFNVWLLEVNSDPSLNKSTSVLKQIITQVVEEATGLAVEVIQRSVRGMPIKGLAVEQDFRKVFSHTNESVQRCVMAETKVTYPQHFVAR